MDNNRKNTLFRYPLTVLAACLSIFFLAGSTFGQGDSIAVSCYAGTPYTYDDIGTVSVWDPSNKAVGICNMVYRDCYARCFACWKDPDDGSEICKDRSGQLFRRS